MSDPLATPADLGVYLGKDIPADDPRALLTLQLAQAKCQRFVTALKPTLVLDATVKDVVIVVAARAYANPTSAHQVGLGSGNVSFGSQNSTMGIGGLYLGREDKRDLRAFAGFTGAFNVDLLQGWPLAPTDTTTP